MRVLGGWGAQSSLPGGDIISGEPRRTTGVRPAEEQRGQSGGDETAGAEGLSKELVFTAAAHGGSWRPEARRSSRRATSRYATPRRVTSRHSHATPRHATPQRHNTPRHATPSPSCRCQGYRSGKTVATRSPHRLQAFGSHDAGRPRNRIPGNGPRAQPFPQAAPHFPGTGPASQPPPGRSGHAAACTAGALARGPHTRRPRRDTGAQRPRREPAAPPDGKTWGARAGGARALRLRAELCRVCQSGQHPPK